MQCAKILKKENNETMIKTTVQQNMLMGLLFSVIAISLLSPIASNTYLPFSPDYANHLGLIVQAKMAILQWQFPIRTAPWEFTGWHYPVYQFYSPLPYTIAAIIFCIKHSNPFIAYKAVIWLALVLGGIYIYRTAYILTKAKTPSLLAGVVYMMAPYFIININVRGAFTEACAQGVLPIALYYTVRTYFDGFNLKNNCITAISWFALAITHLITFVYGSLFIGLFLLLTTMQNKTHWKGLMISGICYTYGCLLSLWFLVPIHIIENKLNIDFSLINPMSTNWLTPLSNLLSSTAISPMPLPGNHLLIFPLYPGIGWCILLSASVCLYLTITSSIPKAKYNAVVRSLLSLFLLLVFLTWSPVNIWKYLPKFLMITQFSYRMLAQVSWVGALLFALAIKLSYKENMKVHEIALALLLIGLASSSWLQTNNSSIRAESVIQNPDMGYGKGGYLLKSNPIPIFYGGINLHFATGDGWLDSGQHLKISNKLIKHNPDIGLHFDGEFATEYLKLPAVLTVKADGDIIHKEQITTQSFSINIPLNKITPSKQKPFVELELLVNKHFVPHDISNESGDLRQLAIRVRSIVLTTRSQDTGTPVERVQPFCTQVGTKTICKLTTSGIVQLPILYYPRLLNITVDGENVPYYPLPYLNGLVLSGVTVKPGMHDITFNFQGIAWANRISLITWILLLFLLIYPIFQSKLGRWYFNPSRQLLFSKGSVKQWN